MSASRYQSLETDPPELRIALVGKTGVGKSAAGNTILGRNAFASRPSFSSVTQKCEKKTGQFGGFVLAVVDTPGLYDTERRREDVVKEIGRSISFCAPGPYVFLVVIQATRFTRVEEKTTKILQEMFGKQAADYMIALITHVDQLRGASIQDLINENEPLRKFIRQCKGGYHLFDNTDSDMFQVTELFRKINTIIQSNGGTFYTHDMFEEAERAIQAEQQLLMSENPNMSNRDIAERDNAFIRGLKWGAIGFTAGALTGAGIGAQIGAVEGGVGAAPAAVVGAVVGGVIGAAEGVLAVVAEEVSSVNR